MVRLSLRERDYCRSDYRWIVFLYYLHPDRDNEPSGYEVKCLDYEGSYALVRSVVHGSGFHPFYPDHSGTGVGYSPVKQPTHSSRFFNPIDSTRPSKDR